ncbi:MAG: hypothetical protein KIH80_006835 [Flavobacteriia bacterium]|nr:hypothetical protein [Flavobacteriia bacterium]
MKNKKLGTLLVIGLFSCVLMAWKSQDVHKFYLSVSQLSYSQKDQAIQMTCRVFIDDFNAVLKERYAITALLGTDEPAPMAEKYAEEYMVKKVQFFEDDQPLDIQLLGYKKDNDVLIYFLEAKTNSFTEAKKFEVRHSLLTDLFEGQQNVVHTQFRGVKKSFLLMKDKPTGIIYFNK